jgi:Tol biopolymer transport system component
MSTRIAAIAVLIAASGALAQTPEPELVAPGVVSTDGGEIFPAFSPDGAALYYNTHDPGWSNHTLVVSVHGDDGWSPPTVLPFSGQGFNDRAPRLSADGSRLYFSSDRPLPAGGTSSFNIWVVERTADEQWGVPLPLPAPINTPKDEYHAAFAADGTIYFAGREWPGGHGRADIYRSRPDGDSWTTPENLGPPINDDLSQPDLYLSPDGGLMILVITGHPDGFGGDDLYVSYFRDGSWTEPRNLGPGVNSAEYEYGPAISPDGMYLYFSSHRRGEGDIYRIELERLDLD